MSYRHSHTIGGANHGRRASPSVSYVPPYRADAHNYITEHLAYAEAGAPDPTAPPTSLSPPQAPAATHANLSTSILPPPPPLPFVVDLTPSPSMNPLSVPPPPRPAHPIVATTAPTAPTETAATTEKPTPSPEVVVPTPLPAVATPTADATPHTEEQTEQPPAPPTVPSPLSLTAHSDSPSPAPVHALVSTTEAMKRTAPTTPKPATPAAAPPKADAAVAVTSSSCEHQQQQQPSVTSALSPYAPSPLSMPPPPPQQPGQPPSMFSPAHTQAAPSYTPRPHVLPPAPAVAAAASSLTARLPELRVILARGRLSGVHDFDASATSEEIYRAFCPAGHVYPSLENAQADTTAADGITPSSSSQGTQKGVLGDAKATVQGHLPPGWERRVVHNSTFYVDHISREAHEQEPWVVWWERAGNRDVSGTQ